MKSTPSSTGDTVSGFSPFADRNKQPIPEVLSRVLPEHGSALEITSGSPAQGVSSSTR